MNIPQMNLYPVVQLAAGGGEKFNAYINAHAILYAEASRNGEIGQSHITLLGGAEKRQHKGRVSVDHSLAFVVERMMPDHILVKRFDSFDRKAFQNDVYVCPNYIRSVYPASRAWILEFIDASTLAVSELPFKG